MAKHNFEKLNIWKDSLDMSIEIYKLFRNSKNYFLRDQVLRSSLSVPSNIAEGCERQTEKDFQRFLRVAAGSSGEARTQIIFASRINDLDNEIAEELVQRYRTLSSQIFTFHNKL